MKQRHGRGSVAALIVLAGLSAVPAAAQQAPGPLAKPIPGAAQPLGSGFAAPAAAGAKVGPEQLRPRADFLIDCAGSPSGAVLKVPDAIARWSTLYCTRNGHLFTTNERYFSAFPGTGKRGAFNAGELGGRRGGLGNKAYFKRIDYRPLSADEARALELGSPAAAVAVVQGKPLFRIDLTIDTGQSYGMVVAAPDQDPFWVIPIVDGKLNGSGFYVASLDYVNRKR
jgi:hypothetical protein